MGRAAPPEPGRWKWSWEAASYVAEVGVNRPPHPTPSPSERPVLRSRTPEGPGTRGSGGSPGWEVARPKVKVLRSWARTEADPGRP